MRALLVILLAFAIENVSSFSVVRPKTFRMAKLSAKKDKKASTYKATAGKDIY